MESFWESFTERAGTSWSTAAERTLHDERNFNVTRESPSVALNQAQRCVKPLASIITPAFNCIDYLADAVDSVRAQTRTDWEHIIVDDGSSDGTFDAIREHTARDPRTRILRNDLNLGPAVARNRGIEAARGRFIAFLDSDDLWLPTKLDQQINFMLDRGVALSYTNYTKISDKDGTPVGHVVSPDLVNERDLLRSNVIACSTAMYDTAVAGRVFMPLVRKRQDWGLWLRLARMGLGGANVGQTLVRYRVRSGSVSSNKMMAMVYTWRFFRDVAALPLYECVYRTTAYAVINARKYRNARRTAGPAA